MQHSTASGTPILSNTSICPRCGKLLFAASQTAAVSTADDPTVTTARPPMQSGSPAAFGPTYPFPNGYPTNQLAQPGYAQPYPPGYPPMPPAYPTNPPDYNPYGSPTSAPTFPQPPSTGPNSPQSRRRLSKGQIAGIAVLAVLVMFSGVGLVLYGA